MDDSRKSSSRRESGWHGPRISLSVCWVSRKWRETTVRANSPPPTRPTAFSSTNGATPPFPTNPRRRLSSFVSPGTMDQSARMWPIPWRIPAGFAALWAWTTVRCSVWNWTPSRMTRPSWRTTALRWLWRNSTKSGGSCRWNRSLAWLRASLSSPSSRTMTPVAWSSGSRERRARRWLTRIRACPLQSRHRTEPFGSSNMVIKGCWPKSPKVKMNFTILYHSIHEQSPWSPFTFGSIFQINQSINQSMGSWFSFTFESISKINQSINQSIGSWFSFTFESISIINQSINQSMGDWLSFTFEFYFQNESTNQSMNQLMSPWLIDWPCRWCVFKLGLCLWYISHCYHNFYEVLRWNLSQQ